jgi:hypothetical protein
VNVLFLAIAGGRRAAILAESEHVVRDGGRATILVDNCRPWRQETLATGVELIGLGALQRDRAPLRIVDRYVVRAPDKLLRLVGRGPVRTSAERLRRTYKRRIAQPIEHRATVAYRRVSRRARNQDLMMSVLRRGDFDYVVVANSQSIVLGAEILDALTTRSMPRPQIRFSVDHLADATTSA